MEIINEPKVEKIWIYNSGIEHGWQKEKMGIRKVNNLKEQKILNRQAELLYFITKEEDTVYIVKESDPDFLKDMQEFGMRKPKTIMIPDDDLPISKIILSNERILHNLKTDNKNKKVLYIPYILSQEDEEICRYCDLPIYGSSSDLIMRLNNKAYARHIVKEIGLPCIDGAICTSKEELEISYNNLKENGYRKFVLKEPYNSAGKGVFFIKDEKQFYSFLKMMRFDAESKDFAVIIEGWIDEKRDINYQIEINDNGEIRLISITEQIIAVTAYKGSLYPPMLTKEQHEYYKECTKKIGGRLFQMGFTGIIGIDSIIDKSGTIYPAIEFNARFNQSTFYIPFLQYFEKENRRVLIRSYDVKTRSNLDYRQLKELLQQNKLFYDKSKKKGIIILNSSCLSIYKDIDDKFENRLYLASVYDYKETNNLHYNNMDNFVKTLD